jgi:hypothetical protein
MSLFDLRAQMGHADIKTAQQYVATAVDSRAEALVAEQAKVIPFRKQDGHDSAGHVRDKVGKQ